ncbi:hypothetical protein T439DRAFT_237689 [Meredithblackwellia eburnea MCA 4105]
MAFIDIPSRGINAFYLCNPSGPGIVGLQPYNSPLTIENKPLDPSKPTLLMIHISTASSSMFTYQFNDPRLRSMNLVAKDGRMHGRTTETGRIKSQPLFTIEDMADDFDAFVDAIGLEKFSILGEGWFGCRIASIIASRRPYQVQGLIYCSPGPFVEPPQIVHGMTVDWYQYATQNKDGNGDQTGDFAPEANEMRD